ncbi:choice-of-anchor U domain-containing protein [uncultured Desulfosarcina sp.]|uniref:PKD domain-containing protein n=1 Tax=uncultured Desulfosarcina sp. TaxID=218289 RepID=UPI0029C8D77E|nr:choice-of-anchor U domain-containing protein [uncultured Desulfosarcina sp.]
MRNVRWIAVAIILLAITPGHAHADSTFATSVVAYGANTVPDAGIFMNWDSTSGFYHNSVDTYPDAGANLDWLLGEVDETVAAGWGGDANGGYLTLYFDTAFTADGTDAADIVVYGFGYAYNTPFTSEKGAITVSASADGENWTVVSDYAGYANGDVWEANPDFTESSPGVQSVIMQIDLDDDISNTYDGAISYLKFELGDGAVGHGRAFFVNAVEGGEMNVAPMAEAGINQEVNPGAEVILDGSGSEDIDDGIATYAWTQIDAGAETTVTLDDATSPTPAFTAPDVPGETLTFELTVTDYAGQSDTDTVKVSIIKDSIITDYYATSVEDESGCISWSGQTADGGENALGLPDYVPDSEGDCSGWNTGSGYLVVKFNNPLEDVDGLDDLAIAHCGTGETEILASADGQSWTSLGTLPAGAAACEEVAYSAYDFGDAGIDDVQYVKIEKTGDTARFIDAVFVPVRIYGATAEDTDDEYPDGCVDWVAKQADDGENALGEPDYDDSTAGIGNCSGWMVEAGRLTIGFDKPFFDGRGNDLNVYHFGRGGANVQVSEDGLAWVSLGELPAGINGGSQLDTAGYDFSDAGVSRVQYVRINKTQVGYTYGRFIDAVEGVYGIPGTIGAAGRDQTVTEGTAVILGSDATDDNPDAVTYAWEQTGGMSVVLSNDGAKNPRFIAPMIDGGKTELRFTVIRTEDSTETEDEVRIIVVDNGITLSATEESHFSEAEIVFNNDVGAGNLDQAACLMGLSCEGGSVVFYEAQDPDSTLSSDYIDDFDNRPKNILYGLLAFDVKTDVVGGTALVSVFLPEAAGSDYRWYKHSDATGWIDFSRSALSDGSGDGSMFSAGRRVVTIRITDGGPYDDDGLANGIVKDPSGLADSTTVDTWHDEGGGGCFIGSLID